MSEWSEWSEWPGVHEEAVERIIRALEARRDHRPRDVSEESINIAIEIVRNGRFDVELPEARRRGRSFDMTNFPVTYVPEVGDVVSHVTAGRGWVVIEGLREGGGLTVRIGRGWQFREKKTVSIHYLTLIDRPERGTI